MNPSEEEGRGLRFRMAQAGNPFKWKMKDGEKGKKTMQG